MMSPIRNGLLALTTAILAGCGTSAPIRHHALTSTAPHQASGSARILVELLPVALPERLNRTEMVLLTGTGQIDMREGDHWTAPLSDEIRQILGDTLWDRLGAVDVYQAPVAPAISGLPQYRLALRIERFEATPGQAAVVGGSWTARQLPQGRSATCRASITVPLLDRTPEGAAAALSAGTGRLTRQVADSVGRLDQNVAPACPPD